MLRRVSTATAIFGVAACSGEAEPRPQLLVVVDTNAPLISQHTADQEISAAATVDTLRIDVVDERGVFDFLDVVAPDPLDWPVSFGLASEAGRRTIRLRLRAFRGAFAEVGSLDGKTTLEPPPAITIDRAVELELPEAGEEVVRLLLDAECFGRPPRFDEGGSTCVGSSQLSAPLSAGVEKLETKPASSAVGTWPRARNVPCHGPARPGARCIPGGFNLIGDSVTVGFEPDNFAVSVPLQPVFLDPFWIDETEFTVGRYRELVRREGASIPLPREPVPDDRTFGYCSWRGVDITGNDAFAVSCLTWDDAQLACEKSGGSLPTEAQWEHAARGRDERRRYPWGEQAPTCCMTSGSRYSYPDVPVVCGGSGPERVGSHPTAECEHPGDVSRDLIRDFAGGLAELTLDAFQTFDGPCWGGTPGIHENPRCGDGAPRQTVRRGASWSEGLTVGMSALRRRSAAYETSATFGFRCAYRDGT